MDTRRRKVSITQILLQLLLRAFRHDFKRNTRNKIRECVYVLSQNFHYLTAPVAVVAHILKWLQKKYKEQGQKVSLYIST